MIRISDTQVNSSSDEIDLFVLSQSIWQQKMLIALVASLAVVVAAAYAFISKPVYEAKAYLTPPTINEIAGFNYGRTQEAQLKPFTVTDVYKVFVRNLQAESLRRDFYTQIYLPSLTETQRQGAQGVLYAEFSKQVSIIDTELSKPVSNVDSEILKKLGIRDTSKEFGRYTVSFQSVDPVIAVNWLKLFVERANAAGLQEMISNVTGEAEVRARNLDQQIMTVRESGKGAREDLITKLHEALSVAESIGLEKMPMSSGNWSSTVSASLDGPLTYMRGAQALKAEIKMLEERASDDPFLPKLRALEVQKSYFQSINVKPESVAIYDQDGPVELPGSPIKPPKALIIGLGLVLGVMLGVMLALFRHFISTQRAGSAPPASVKP